MLTAYLHGIELDIVSVTTPPSAHAEATIAALEAGAHVLCEKPMAMMVETYWFSDRDQQAPFVELKGDRGTAVFERGTSSLEVWMEDEQGEIVDVSPESLPIFEDAALVGVEIAEFVEAVRTGGRPLVSPEEALNVQRILSGINESGTQRREIELR